MKGQSSPAAVGSSPLNGPIPEEILLQRPPLKWAIAQVLFSSPILSLNQPDSPMVAKFQESVRQDYPKYQIETQIPVMIGEQGQGMPVGAIASHVHHRFADKNGSGITLTKDFVSFTTTCYQRKDEFISQVKQMCIAVSQHIKPEMGRLGVRFVDRVEGDGFEDIEKYVDSNFLGPLPMFGQQAPFLMAEAHLKLPADAQTMIIRWGKLPANHQIPHLDAISPIGHPSWILDIDIHTRLAEGSDVEQIADQTDKSAGRIYAFFRKVFNDDFIRYCGGTL